jgi:hypothetical protein
MNMDSLIDPVRVKQYKKFVGKCFKKSYNGTFPSSEYFKVLSITQKIDAVTNRYKFYFKTSERGLQYYGSQVLMPCNQFLGQHMSLNIREVSEEEYILSKIQ